VLKLSQARGSEREKVRVEVGGIHLGIVVFLSLVGEILFCRGVASRTEVPDISSRRKRVRTVVRVASVYDSYIATYEQLRSSP
jgi:hypothetical protein